MSTDDGTAGRPCVEDLQRFSRERMALLGVLRAGGLDGDVTWIRNAYWPAHEEYDDVRQPWAKVMSRCGPVFIGWRKKVIAIDWSASTFTARGADVVADPSTTHGNRSCHAYGYEEAALVLSRLTASYALASAETPRPPDDPRQTLGDPMIAMVQAAAKLLPPEHNETLKAMHAELLFLQMNTRIVDGKVALMFDAPGSAERPAERNRVALSALYNARSKISHYVDTTGPERDAYTGICDAIAILSAAEHTCALADTEQPQEPPPWCDAKYKRREIAWIRIGDAWWPTVVLDGIPVKVTVDPRVGMGPLAQRWGPRVPEPGLVVEQPAATYGPHLEDANDREEGLLLENEAAAVLIEEQRREIAGLQDQVKQLQTGLQEFCTAARVILPMVDPQHQTEYMRSLVRKYAKDPQR